MRVIYCVAFDPVDKSGGVGGVDWRVQRTAAESLYAQRLSDPDYNSSRITFFELRVPEGLCNSEITRLADEAAWGEFYRPVMRREPVPAVQEAD